MHAYLTAQGYTVRGEVTHCDIAAVKGDDLIVIEMKLALNLPLLVQGVRRQQMTDLGPIYSLLRVIESSPGPAASWKRR